MALASGTPTCFRTNSLYLTPSRSISPSMSRDERVSLTVRSSSPKSTLMAVSTSSPELQFHSYRGGVRASNPPVTLKAVLIRSTENTHLHHLSEDISIVDYNLYSDEYVSGSTGDYHRRNAICNYWPDGMEMSLPSSSYTPVEDPLKWRLFGLPWGFPFELLKMDMKSSNNMILKALHQDMVTATNLVEVVKSTDPLVFVIAIAKCFGIDLTLEGFPKAVEDLKHLLFSQEIVKPNHIMKKAHINRAPLRSVAKITGKDRLDSFDYSTGTSFVFKGEKALPDAISEDPSSFEEMIKPEEDHAKKEAHIDLALQGSVPKPTGTTALDFEGEEPMRTAFSEDPSSSKGKAVLIMEEEGPISGSGMLEMLTQKNTTMGAGLRQESSPRSSVRGMRPKTLSSRHKRRRTSYDSGRMVDEILKNDQEASFASCPCLKEVHDPSRCCCGCSEVLRVQLVSSSCQCLKQGRDLSGCCCWGSKVVCDPRVDSSCQCSNVRDPSGCYCPCMEVVCDPPPVSYSCRCLKEVRNPSRCCCQCLKEVHVSSGGCCCQCSKMVPDTPVGYSSRCSNVHDPSGCCCQCYKVVRDPPVGSSCQCSKEVSGPLVGCAASNKKLELALKEMQKSLITFCVVGFMWMTISFFSPPGCRYCY